MFLRFGRNYELKNECMPWKFAAKKSIIYSSLALRLLISLLCQVSMPRQIHKDILFKTTLHSQGLKLPKAIFVVLI